MGSIIRLISSGASSLMTSPKSLRTLSFNDEHSPFVGGWGVGGERFRVLRFGV
jgi:hypothetical protein